MAIRRGEIITRIIENGLTHNIDPSNRVTYPRSGIKVYNTIDTDITGSFMNDVEYNNESPDNFQFGLDGVDDIIRFESHFAAYGQTDITLSYWFKLLGDPNINWHGLSNEIATQLPYRSRILIKQNLAQLLYILTANGQKSITPISFSLDTWHNVVITKDSIVGTKVYLDNVYKGGHTTETGAIRGLGSTTVGGTDVGRGYESGYYMNGKIGCIHVYNRALSTTELTHNYNAMIGRFS
jgi:hypothetical protein